MKRLAVMVTIFLLILALAGSAAAYTYTTYSVDAQRTTFIRNDDGVYLIGYGGYKIQVERLAPNPTGATLDLRYPVDDVGVFDGTVVAICGDRDNHQLIVYTYDIDSDNLDSFAVAGLDFTNGFYYDGSGVWMIDENNGSIMNHYSRTGRRTNSYTFSNRVTYIADGDGCGYVVCAGALYRLSGDSVTMISNARVNSPLCYLGNGMLSDVNGRIYQLNSNSLSLLYSLDTDYDCASACITGGYLYYPVGEIIYQYDLSGVKRGCFEIDGKVVAMFTEGGSICAVTDGGYTINRIDPSEFRPIRNTANNQNDNHNTDNGDSLISSDVYRVDYDTFRITGITSPTTFAQFKSRMRYNGYTARLYRGGNEVKSGNVGTAMQVVFSNNSRSYTFELGVIGDLTGEGNVNSRDIGDMMGYLLGTVTFNGVYIDAGDLKEDGIIDVADLALLCRMVG